MKEIYLQGTKSVFEYNIIDNANKELDLIEEREKELENEMSPAPFKSTFDGGSLN